MLLSCDLYKFKFLKMEKILTFVKPKNEATVKFYTEVLKNRLGIEPNPFLPKKSAQALITRCLSLTQFNLHSHISVIQVIRLNYS